VGLRGERELGSGLAEKCERRGAWEIAGRGGRSTQGILFFMTPSALIFSGGACEADKKVERRDFFFFFSRPQSRAIFCFFFFFFLLFWFFFLFFFL